VTKSDSPDPVLAGAVLTYTVTAKNNGPSGATGVVVTDALPAGVTYLSASPSQGSCLQNAGTVSCSLGPLVNGATATVTIQVSPQQAGQLSNQASITGNESDPNSANNTSPPVTTTVSPAADLSVTKTDSPDPVHVGQPLTYTIVVSNNGPSPAMNVSIQDQLPKNAGYGKPSTTQGTCSLKPDKRLLTCNLGTMASGSIVTVTIVIKPTAKGTITNTVSVSAASPVDPNTANNSSTASTRVMP